MPLGPGHLFEPVCGLSAAINLDLTLLISINSPASSADAELGFGLQITLLGLQLALPWLQILSMTLYSRDILVDVLCWLLEKAFKFISSPLAK